MQYCNSYITVPPKAFGLPRGTRRIGVIEVTMATVFGFPSKRMIAPALSRPKACWAATPRGSFEKPVALARFNGDSHASINITNKCFRRKAVFSKRTQGRVNAPIIIRISDILGKSIRTRVFQILLLRTSSLEGQVRIGTRSRTGTRTSPTIYGLDLCICVTWHVNIQASREAVLQIYL